MNLQDIQSKLNKNKIGIIGENSEYKKYSVMIPIVNINGEMNVIFETRAKSLRSQPGEISFPGGGIESGEDSLDAAIRETCEELNLKTSDMDVLGQMDTLVTQHNKIIYTFVCYIHDNVNIEPSLDEVDHVFYVPIKYFIETKPLISFANITTVYEGAFPLGMGQGEDYTWDVGKNKIYFYKYNDYIIWGITAKILLNLIERF